MITNNNCSKYWGYSSAGQSNRPLTCRSQVRNLLPSPIFLIKDCIIILLFWCSSEAERSTVNRNVGISKFPTRAIFMGLQFIWFRMLACHARGSRFESGQSRHFYFYRKCGVTWFSILHLDCRGEVRILHFRDYFFRAMADID